MKDVRPLLRFAVVVPLLAPAAARAEAERPNVLFAISDDQSYIHTGANGDDGVSTPAFDRVASEGVRFTHAYAAAPSCTPSRSAVLTGQAIYRLEAGGLLFGTLPAEFPVYPRLLAREAGYFVGYTGKGWGPGRLSAGGREKDPVGEPYSAGGYAASFAEFLKDRPDDEPFCFWYGAHEPHLPHPTGRGLEQGKELSDARLPGGLPDVRVTRRDILDYYTEIEHFDDHLGRMLNLLEKRGELSETLVLVTSDHGNPFPRSKATLYDSGTRVPLAIRYPPSISAGRVVRDFVSLTDLAPTILAYAGVDAPAQMTGRSLRPLLSSDASGWTGEHRSYVVTAFERHTWCRPDGTTYPMRSIRTRRYHYIRNYAPNRWPAGAPDFDSPHQGFYGDVDDSPTKEFMIEHRDDPEIEPYFERAFRKRPAHELYDVRDDPKEMENLADDAEYRDVREDLRRKLTKHLKRTDDPRAHGRSPWGGYPYYYKDYWKRAESN